MDIAKLPIDITDLAEVEENPYHPYNDRFYKDLQHTQNIIMAHQRSMKPNHVKIAKLHFAGRSNVDISEAIDRTPQTVSNALRRPDVKKLLTLLHYIDAAMEGPNAAQRRAVLTRIMVDHEKEQPKVALLAISEMNKMDMNDHAIDSGTNPGQTTIIINQNTFPKTELDK